MGRISWVLIGWLALLPAAHSASFDCAKAATDVEKMICGDSNLSQLDSDVAAAYQETLQAGADRLYLLHQQRKWMEFPRNRCTDVTCLTRAYTGRLRQLKDTQAALTAMDRTGLTQDDARLKAFIITYSQGRPERYSKASVSLDGGATTETFVYLTQGCGMGGCAMFLLQPSGDALKAINFFTITKLPVYVLPSKTNGWSDIAVTVGGGGLRYGTALLKFDGQKYPSNPSLVPMVTVDPTQPGVIKLPLSY